MAWTDIPQYIIDDILGFQNMNQVVDNFDFLKAGGVGNVYLTNFAVTPSKLATSAVQTAKINNLAVTTAKIAAANVTLVKLAADAKVSTGTYNGDGTVSQAIAGIGFQPRGVIIVGYDSNGFMFLKTDTMPATGSWFNNSASTGTSTNGIIALGADGFTVDDNGIDVDPNKNGRTYYYMCWG